MKARLSPKHVIALLLAVLVTAGFSLSAGQASAMSAKMAVTPSIGMTMLSDTKMTMPGMRAAGDCAACQKGSGDNGNPNALSAGLRRTCPGGVAARSRHDDGSASAAAIGATSPVPARAQFRARPIPSKTQRSRLTPFQPYFG